MGLWYWEDHFILFSYLLEIVQEEKEEEEKRGRWEEEERERMNQIAVHGVKQRRLAVN